MHILSVLKNFIYYILLLTNGQILSKIRLVKKTGGRIYAHTACVAIVNAPSGGNRPASGPMEKRKGDEQRGYLQFQYF